MSDCLKKQIALVTGANSGLGRAIAETLAAAGAKVLVHYLDSVNQGQEMYHSALGKSAAAEVVAGILDNGGMASLVAADLAEVTSASQIFDAAEKIFGPVSLLVNNAAHCQNNDTILRINHEIIDSHFNVNVRAALLLSRELAIRQHDGGAIVNISTDGARTFAGQISYGASKAALESLTRSLAVELGPLGIRVNAIASGPINTNDWMSKNLKDALLKSIPLKRLGQPEDVAQAALFLLSPQSSWITGQVLRVTGGHNL